MNPVQVLVGRSEQGTIVLLIRGRITRADIPEWCCRVRALLEATHASQVVGDVGGLLRPGAATVDALARLRLSARRLGRTVRLRNPSPDLRDLLELLGMSDVVRPCEPLTLEPRGQSEQREELGGVEEERDSADPVP